MLFYTLPKFRILALLQKDLNTATEGRNLSTKEFNNLIIEAIKDKKGQGIVKLDLRHLEASADFYIICHGNSDTQAKAIAGGVHKTIKEATDQLPNHIEGMNNGTWVLVDYFTVLVHVFHKESRQFYNLEALWSDAKITEYQDL
jgi:ribosome-associated protein